MGWHELSLIGRSGEGGGILHGMGGKKKKNVYKSWDAGVDEGRVVWDAEAVHVSPTPSPLPIRCPPPPSPLPTLQG